MSTATGTPHREVSDVALAMAEAARLAPSVHNTQPWRFEPLPDGLAIHEDAGRALPALDPRGRQRTMSCAAAAVNAALALAHAGIHPVVELLPDPARPDLLATVRSGRPAAPGDAELRRFAAIPRRRAHRRLHQRRELTADDVETLCEAVAGEGARPVVPDAPARRRLGALLRRAVTHQLGDADHLAEVDRWVRHPGDPQEHADGIPVASLGTTPYPADSIVHDGWDPEELDEVPVESELEQSTIIAITTRGDTRRDWLVAGMALERLWLDAAARDLAVTFADQATQRPETRDHAAAVLGVPGELQLVLRVGYPLVDVPVTPRRPLESLWL
ncbi:MAG TPA: nitroreductase family protein [Angustibacter sp.]|nr:nitroreductase family protein [Angustibacter sp.]